MFSLHQIVPVKIESVHYVLDITDRERTKHFHQQNKKVNTLLN